MGLELRFTEAETSLAPPDIAAFAAVDHGLLREQAADHDDISPLGDLAAASLIAARMRIVDAEPARARAPVFLSQRHWPIPPLSPELTAPAVDAFMLADHVHGHFAWPQPPRSQRRGAALVLAACIPMFLPDTALAQQPAGAMIPPAPAPAAAPVLPPPPTTAVAPNWDEAQTPPRPEQPSLQAVLHAMKGHEAVVYVGDRKITGLIIGVDGGFVMMVDEERDGRIAMIPKEQITDVRGKLGGLQRRAGISGVELPPDGTGLLAGGGVLVALGGPLFVSGVVFVAITPSFTPLWMPQLLPALVFLGAGIPMLVGGSRRRRAYQEAVFGARLGQRVSPAFGRTPGGGWTGGLTLRF